MSDTRSDAAQYYDLGPQMPDDVPFYVDRVPSPDATILELGCGTGRVLVPLTSRCAFIQGVDRSEGMLAICRARLGDSGISPSRARLLLGDITDLSLGRAFDLIIAPFRVMQNLESDAQVDGLFATVQSHLAPDGTCILTAFRPNRGREELIRYWTAEEAPVASETQHWETLVEGDRITCSERRARIDAERMVLYPELVYRRYRGDQMIDKAILKIAMRCYYPDEFMELITAHGFTIVDSWGGYHGERCGEGPELVIQFGAPR